MDPVGQRGRTRRRSSLQAATLTPSHLPGSGRVSSCRSMASWKPTYPAERARAVRRRIGEARPAARARSPHGAPRDTAKRFRRRRRLASSAHRSRALVFTLQKRDLAGEPILKAPCSGLSPRQALVLSTCKAAHWLAGGRFGSMPIASTRCSSPASHRRLVAGRSQSRA